MQFSDLYAEALSVELGSEDVSRLFTLVRRKKAINDGALQFARLTRCYVTTDAIPLVDGVAAINLDTAFGPGQPFLGWGKEPVRVAVTTVSNGAVATTEVLVKSPAWMAINMPDWESGGQGGVPSILVSDARDGQNSATLYPTPTITAAETWQLLVPFVTQPPIMQGDTDLPFAGLPGLTAYHQALAHFGAAQLERLRRNPDQVKDELAQFGAYVQDFMMRTHPRGTHRHVSQQRDYQRPSHTAGYALLQGDPRR